MSEFGSGIVVCLAKFSEHLANHWAEEFRYLETWKRYDEAKRDSMRLEAEKYPQGDAARFLASVETWTRAYSEKDPSMNVLFLWANGASDHFYDLDEKAPEPLKELADYMLNLGHGVGLMGEWPDSPTDTWKKIWRLWQESCLAVDAMLEVKADWGKW